MYIDNKMDSLTSLKSIKRHYKKDSRYVNDLYTLTYDNHESLEDTVELISSLYFRTDIAIDKPNESQKYLGAADRLIRNAHLQHRLTNAKDASIQHFEHDKSRQGVSPMASFVKQTLKKVNREQKQQQPTPSTLFTPQMLKTMNVTQLQIVINEIYDFRGVLNETVIKNLVERDELLSKRDAMLSTIEKTCGQKRYVERKNTKKKKKKPRPAEIISF